MSVTLIPYSPTCKPISALTTALLKDLYVAFAVTLPSAQSLVKLSAVEKEKKNKAKVNNDDSKNKNYDIFNTTETKTYLPTITTPMNKLIIILNIHSSL